jgi:HPt (histidine-containing phosphotransfer) domain-containing protein
VAAARKFLRISGGHAAYLSNQTKEPQFLRLPGAKSFGDGARAMCYTLFVYTYNWLAQHEEVICVPYNGRDYIDVEDGLKRVRGNKKLYRRMLAMYEASGEFAAFEKAIAEGDMAKACEVIHGIKGMAGNLSVKRVFELSTELNEQLKQGAYDEATLSAYREACLATQECMPSVVAELEA